VNAHAALGSEGNGVELPGAIYFGSGNPLSAFSINDLECGELGKWAPYRKQYEAGRPG
jgi:hypothetical protein